MNVAWTGGVSKMTFNGGDSFHSQTRQTTLLPDRRSQKLISRRHVGHFPDMADTPRSAARMTWAATRRFILRTVLPTINGTGASAEMAGSPERTGVGLQVDGHIAR